MSGSIVLSDPVVHRAWIAARRGLVEAHAGDGRIAALLGPPGIGKTFLLGELERHFRQANYGVERIDHGDLLTGEESAHVLLVDEADRLDDATLQALAARGRGFVLLAALPGFAARLAPLDARLVRLGPLEADEVPGYVAGRLANLGFAPDRFGDEALSALAAASEGVPRLLNTLMGSSAFLAEMEGETRVGARHVTAAAELRADVASQATMPSGAAAWATEALPEPPRAFPAPAAAMPQPGATQPGAAPAGPAPMDLALPDASPPVRRRRRGLPWLGAGAALLALALAAAWWRPDGPGTAGQAADAPSPTGGTPPAASARPTEVLRQALSTAATPPLAPPAAPLAAPTAALPAAPQPRVVLTYPRRDAQAGERAAALAAKLAQAGWLVGSPFPVSRAPAAPALRYFFGDDREAALALAALAGAEGASPQLGTIPPGTPLPRPGTLELALAAGPTPAATRIAATPQEPPAEPAPPPASLLAPLDRGTVAAAGLQLRWSVPGGAQPGCCYVEVVTLPVRDAADASREVFAGYGERADSQPLALAEPRPYAWRVIHVSRDALRYAASPWSSFTLGRELP